MAMIDMTHRKLRFPPRFIPYLERHRIFELFHVWMPFSSFVQECVELLVQERPKDHIQFLKNVLPCAAMKKDKQRIVFISPISFDRETFSELLADCLGIQAINVMNLETLTRNKQAEDVVKIQAMSESESEEESCICPGEFVEQIMPPFYYPTASEAGFTYGSAAPSEVALMDEGRHFGIGSIGGTEEEEEKEGSRETLCKEEKGEEEGKEPCICVCPCKKRPESEEDVQENREMKDVNEEVQKDKLEEKVRLKKEILPVEEMEREEEEEAVDEGEDIWKYYPCKPVKSKKREWKDQVCGHGVTGAQNWMSPIVSSSIIEIDFGILRECEMTAKGWILEDFPVTEMEAEKLNALGIIPTHALRIIIDEQEEEKNREYKMVVKGWMKAYKYVPVMDIRVNGRNLMELVQDLCSLLSLMPHRHAPMLPRIVLIGSRGSGVTTQAEKLAFKYGMVHVEYDVVMSRALEEDDELCKMYKVQRATRPDPELEAVILERALLTAACRNRGWVLTGYPKDVDQLRMLDIMATPPNRVIFIEVPARECFVRLYYRKTDWCSGDEYKLPIIQPSGVDSYETPGMDPTVAERLMSHPRNNKKQIIRDIEEYFLRKDDMKTYCGKTASYVDGDHEADRVFERIEKVIINPAPPHPPRDPLSIHHGIEESYERLKKFRLSRGMFFNNLLLNPPEKRQI